MTRGLSLAHKCQILFGLAILLLLMAALSVPWFRVASLARQSQTESCEMIADSWLKWGLLTTNTKDANAEDIFAHLAFLLENESKGSESATQNEAGDSAENTGQSTSLTENEGDSSTDKLMLRLISLSRLHGEKITDPFLHTAVQQFQANPDLKQLVTTRKRREGGPVFRFVRAIRAADLVRNAKEKVDSNPLLGVLVVEQHAGRAAGLLLIDRMYIIATGIATGVLASLVFYWITTRLILGPVRVLRDLTERVQQGELTVRSDIRTRDEFEQLSDTFNAMLIAFKEQQDNLRSANQSLDSRLTELAQTNVDLYEAARLKGEFLAAMSHELRTPLNSIIGFAELLQEIAEREIPREEQTPEQTKRFRYISNIVSSGRTLLDMITELLEMAKIETGKIAIRIEPTNVGELCNLLAGLIRPQARKRKITLNLQIDSDLPLVETDPGRLRQIIFNFLSNAVKFVPQKGRIDLRATAREEKDPNTDRQRQYIHISIADNGPGIPENMQHAIFEKFRQLDSGPTRGYAGTGLGLAICKELATLLHARIMVVSLPEYGSLFSIVIPRDYIEGEQIDKTVTFIAADPTDIDNLQAAN